MQKAFDAARALRRQRVARAALAADRHPHRGRRGPGVGGSGRAALDGTRGDRRRRRAGRLLDGLMLLARSDHGVTAREPLDLAAVASTAARDRPARGRARPPRSAAGQRGRRATPAGAPRREPDRERRPLQRPGRLRLRDARAPWTAKPCSRSPTAARSSRPRSPRGSPNPSSAAAAPAPAARGSGLSIVRSVAEAHGGRVSLTPRREGGLAIRVVLPAANGEQTADPRVKSRSASSPLVASWRDLTRG